MYPAPITHDFLSFQAAQPIENYRQITSDGSDPSLAANMGSHEHQLVFSSDVVSLENVESHFGKELRDAARQHGNPRPIISGELDTTRVHSNFDGSVSVRDTTVSPVPITDAIFLEKEEAIISNSHFHEEEEALAEDVPKESGHSLSTTEEQLDPYTLDVRATRGHHRIRDFRNQAVTPVSKITKTGALSPPCGCYTCGTCGTTHLDAGYHSLITCPVGFDRCCFPEDPWPDFVATEAESLAPCALPSRCRRSYGVSPLDLQLFGVLLPCYLGQVRCLDMLLQEAELMPPLPQPLPCPVAGVRGASGAGFPTPMLDIHFKKMSLAETNDLPTRLNGHLKKAERPGPTTELLPSTSPKHFEKVSSSEPESGDSEYDRVSPTQPGDGSSSTNVKQLNEDREENPVTNHQISVPDLPEYQDPLQLEGMSSNNSILLPVREYLMSDKVLQPTESSSSEEKVAENTTPVINNAYLPPASDADGELVEPSTRVSKYGTPSSAIDWSTPSSILNPKSAMSSVNFDLYETASNFDYDLDEAESVTEVVGTPISPAQPLDSEASHELWLTDDLATAASLLSAVGGIHHNDHHSPDHHHHQHRDQSEPPSAHKLPSSGLHVISAPDLSLLTQQFPSIRAPPANLHVRDGDDRYESPTEPQAVAQPTPPTENESHSKLSVPAGYLTTPIEENYDLTGITQPSVPVRLTVADSLTNIADSLTANEQFGTAIRKLKQESFVINNNTKGMNTDLLARTAVPQFMSLAKPKGTSLSFPDSVSVEIKESENSSIEIPIPCGPVSSCHRLFGRSARDFNVLGSLPGCPDGEGRCLDHVLMVYTRLGKHEQVLFGDMSSLKTSGTIIEIKSAPIAGDDNPSQSMTVHAPPEFSTSVAFFGGKMVFPAASDHMFRRNVSSSKKEEIFTGEISYTEDNETSGGRDLAAPAIVTQPNGDGGAVVTGTTGAGSTEDQAGWQEQGVAITNDVTDGALVNYVCGGGCKIQTSEIDGSVGVVDEFGIHTESNGTISVTGGPVSEKPKPQTGGIHITGETSGLVSINTGGTTANTTVGSLGVEIGTQTRDVDISGVSGEPVGEVDIGSSGGEIELQTADIDISGGIVGEVAIEAGGSGIETVEVGTDVTGSTSGDVEGEITVVVAEQGAVPAASGLLGYGSAATSTQGAGMGYYYAGYRAPSRPRPRYPINANGRPFRLRTVYEVLPPNPQYRPPPPQPKHQYEAPQIKPKRQYAFFSPKPKPQYGRPPQPNPEHQHGIPPPKSQHQHEPPQPNAKPQHSAPQPKPQYELPPPLPKLGYGPSETQPKLAYGPQPIPSYEPLRLHPKPIRSLYQFSPAVVKIPDNGYHAPGPSSHYESPTPKPVKITLSGYPAQRPGSQYGSQSNLIKMSNPSLPAPSLNFYNGPPRPATVKHEAATPVRLVKPRPQYGPLRPQSAKHGYPLARPGYSA